MKMKTQKNINQKQSGQVLLFVVVVMTIALVIGIAISTQTLRSISQVSDIDISFKDVASGEGFMEQALNLSNTQLSNFSATECTLISGVYSSGKCTYTSTVDNVQVENVLTVEKLYDDSGTFSFTLEAGDMREVFFDPAYTGTLDICWTNSTSRPDILFTLYNKTANKVVRTLIDCDDSGRLCYNSDPSSTSVHPTSTDDTSCYTADLSPSYYDGIRIRAIGPESGETTFELNDGGNNVLGEQGNKLTVESYVVEDANTTRSVVKKVIVEKTLPSLTGLLDFSMYSDESID